ncbi:GIY-YIG nuclease family protein [Sulfurimonas sp.]|uniref:GIY-YIG nuclease family protein n=2 Tax=unclassified Sulfurimonas TaxID=2623549 RepID=UPI00262D7032|nr:GIY-YIG nuclease family protein [Sulfurimonas sp.]
MIEFSLDEILNDDPLNLLSEAKARVKSLNEDDRLLATFEEINTFFELNGHEPQKSTNMSERTLHSRLEGIKKNPEKIEYLKPYDRYNLLKKIEINSIDDILNDDVFGLLGGDAQDDIFTLKNVPKQKEITMPDYVASRKPCKEFAKYEQLFKDVQSDLRLGKRTLCKFQNEQEIHEREFYILKGVMVYVASKGRLGRIKGKLNTRLKCIYENGTESNVLMRSLSRELYRDGKRVSLHDDRVLDKLSQITEEDTKSGYIYILESLSKEDKITTIKNLYKIGYSTTDVKERIKNAINEPTYLMAAVRIVAVYETYNMNTQKFEQLIHRFFGKVCLNVDIFGSNAKRYTPREWFIAPLEIVEQAIELIITGEIINYRYDEKNEDLVLV